MDNTNSSPIYKKGTFFERLVAYIIDLIIVQIFLIILNFIATETTLPQVPFLGNIIGLLFGSLFIWKVGATPGKMAMRLKVVKSTYQSVPFGYALLRESVGKFVSGFFF